MPYPERHKYSLFNRTKSTLKGSLITTPKKPSFLSHLAGEQDRSQNPPLAFQSSFSSSLLYSHC